MKKGSVVSLNLYPSFNPDKRRSTSIPNNISVAPATKPNATWLFFCTGNAKGDIYILQRNKNEF
jgi:hypothetical protein